MGFDFTCTITAFDRAVRRRNGEKAQILPVPIVTSFRGHYISDRVASRQLNFLAN
jgi:hypothetical protein